MKAGGVILAGGKGRRLGAEKAGVLLLGKTLLERAISGLEFLQSEIVIVLAPGQSLPETKSAAQLKMVYDSVIGKGPLAGIQAGLTNSDHQYNVVIACDMPLVNRHFIRHMVSISKGFDAVIPRLGSYLEPLQAVYSKTCLPEIEKLMSDGSLSAAVLSERVKTRYLDSPEIERFDPGHLSFININTPADLKTAEGFLRPRG